MILPCVLHNAGLRNMFIIVIVFGTIIEVFLYLRCCYSFSVFDWKSPALPLRAAAYVPDLPPYSGFLNHHIWYGVCFVDLEDLCSFPIFPKAPDNRTYIGKTGMFFRSRGGTAQRIFGFITPPETGKYNFNITSDGSAEMWISTEDSRGNIRRVADAGREEKRVFAASDIKGLNSQLFQSVELIHGRRYYMEIIKSSTSKDSYLRVAWRRPGSSKLEDIDPRNFLPFTNDTGFESTRVFDEKIPDVPACSVRRTTERSPYFKWTKKPYVSYESVKHVLPVCRYNPSYTVNRKMSRWEAVNMHVVHTFLYPFPQHAKLGDAKKWYYPLDKREALVVAQAYLNELEKAYPK